MKIDMAIDLISVDFRPTSGIYGLNLCGVKTCDGTYRSMFGLDFVEGTLIFDLFWIRLFTSN